MKQKKHFIRNVYGIVTSMLISAMYMAQEVTFTIYGHGVEKGELKFMLMIDHTSP